MDKIKILFVCLGNICRSPSAEAVMKGVAERHGQSNDFEIDSAGIISFHKGKPADSRMKRHAANRGLDLTSISRPINPERDFKYFDLIIGMDNQNIRDLKGLAPSSDTLKKIVKMTDFSSGGKYSEVPDPYYGGAEGFELVLDLLDDACEGLFQHLTHNSD